MPKHHSLAALILFPSLALAIILISFVVANAQTSTSTPNQCTGLNLVLNDNKTTYNRGESVNYTYTCTPDGYAAYVGIQVVKPDGTATTYNYATNIHTSTMGFETSNFTPGNYILRACFNESCSPVTASAPFTVAAPSIASGNVCSVSGSFGCAADGNSQLYCNPSTSKWQFSQYCSTSNRTCHASSGMCKAICGDGICGIYETAADCPGYNDCPVTACTKLKVTLAENKTAYTKGDNVSYTFSCETPSGSPATNGIVKLVKPDGTVSILLSVTGATSLSQSYGFPTTDFTAGAYTLKVCWEDACPAASTGVVNFTISAPAPLPPPVCSAGAIPSSGCLCQGIEKNSGYCCYSYLSSGLVWTNVPCSQTCQSLGGVCCAGAASDCTGTWSNQWCTDCQGYVCCVGTCKGTIYGPGAPTTTPTPGASAPEPLNDEPGVWAQVDIATGQILTATICTRSVCGINGEYHGYVPPASWSTGAVWWPTSKRYIWQVPGQAGYSSGTFNFNTYVFTVSGGTIYNGVFTPTATPSPQTTDAHGSALDVANVTNLLSKIWGPGSNGIILGGGLNYSTQPGVGWSQQYGGKYVTSYSIQGASSNYLTQTASLNVSVIGPAGSIIEVWDLESLTVIATNSANSGAPVIFAAQPNHRYGGFAWYADNAQKNIEIRATQSSVSPPSTTTTTPITTPSAPTIPTTPQPYQPTPIPTMPQPFLPTPPASSATSSLTQPLAPLPPASLAPGQIAPTPAAPPIQKWDSRQARLMENQKKSILRELKDMERYYKRGKNNKTSLADIAALRNEINVFKPKDSTAFETMQNLQEGLNGLRLDYQEVTEKEMEFTRAKQSMRSLEQFLAPFREKVQKIERGGGTVAQTFKDALANGKELVKRVRAAKNHEEIQAIMDDEQFASLGTDINDYLPELERLAYLPDVLRIMNKQTAEGKRLIKVTTATARRFNLDAAEQIEQMKTLLAAIQETIVKLKTEAMEIIDMPGYVRENASDKLDDLRQIADQINAVANVRQFIKQTATDIKKYTKRIGRLEKDGESMSFAYVLLDGMTKNLDELRPLAAKRLTADTAELVIAYLQDISDTRKQLEEMLRVVSPDILEQQLQRLFETSGKEFKPMEIMTMPTE